MGLPALIPHEMRVCTVRTMCQPVDTVGSTLVSLPSVFKSSHPFRLWDDRAQY